MIFFQYPGHKGDLTQMMNDIPEYEDRDHRVVKIETYGERAYSVTFVSLFSGKLRRIA